MDTYMYNPPGLVCAKLEELRFVARLEQIIVLKLHRNSL